MDALPKAIALGWGKLYMTVPEFRETFRHMMSAVDQLPSTLVKRGRALDYRPYTTRAERATWSLSRGSCRQESMRIPIPIPKTRRMSLR